MPAPDQNKPNPNDPIVIDKFSGLRNTVSEERLAPGELAAAVNVDIDDAGQAHRRRGHHRVAAGAWHSVWEGEDATYGVKNQVLGVINPDYSFRPLVPVNDDPIAYVQIDKTVYFTSETVAGKIVDGEVVPWGAPDGQNFWYSPVVNPSPTLPAIRGRLLGRPPLASCMTSYNGRIYMGSGRTVWATELYAYDYVDKTRNFWQFEGDITMIAAVTDGIYVGTNEGCYFVGGTLIEPKRMKIMDAAVIPRTAVFMPIEVGNPLLLQRNPNQNMTVSVAFLTSAGHCLGGDSGQCFNITEDRFIFPGAVRGAALFRRQDGVNQYVATIESEGDPAQSARFGDYVDAEIRRGGGSWNTLSGEFRMGDRVDAVLA